MVLKQTKRSQELQAFFNRPLRDDRTRRAIIIAGMTELGRGILGRWNLDVSGGGFGIRLKLRRSYHAALVLIVRVGIRMVRGVEGHDGALDLVDWDHR